MIIKRASFAILFFILFSSSIHASGRIYLFTDDYSTRMSTDIEAYGTRNIYIAYSSENGAGPDDILAMHFKIESGSEYVYILNPPVWEDFVCPTWGCVEEGIFLNFYDCQRLVERFLFVGYFTILSLQEISSGDPSVFLRVLTGTSYAGTYLAVFDCEKKLNLNGVYVDAYTQHDVVGAFFYLPYEASKISSETSSWGAIKSLWK